MPRPDLYRHRAINPDHSVLLDVCLLRMSGLAVGISRSSQLDPLPDIRLELGCHAQNFAHWNWLQSERSWSWRIMSAVVSAIYLSTIRRQRFIPSRRFDLAHIALGSLLGYIDFHWLDGPVAAGRVEQVEWRGRLVSVAPSISSSQPQRGEDSGRGRPKFEPASNGDRSAVDVHAAARCRRRAGAQGLTSSGVPYRPADL